MGRNLKQIAADMLLKQPTAGYYNITYETIQFINLYRIPFY